MRKLSIAAFVAFIALILSSCTQYILADEDWFGTGGGSVIRSLEDLEDAALNAKNGDTLRLVNVRINPESFRLPIELNADVKVTGSISITENASVSGRVAGKTVASGDVVIFEVADKASVEFSDFSVSVTEAAASEIKAIISVDGGELKADSVSANVSGSSALIVNTIYLGVNATAAKIQITDNEGGISIDQSNTDSALADKVIENNPDADIATPYDASTSEEFLKKLANLKKVRLTANGKLTINSFPVVENTSYDIDLNGNTLIIDSNRSTIDLPKLSSVVIHDGNLVTKDIAKDDYGYYTKAAIGMKEGSSLILKRVHYDASHSGGVGMLAVPPDISARGAHFSLIDSDMITIGVYGVGTNASTDGEGSALTSGVTIDIIRSTITARGDKEKDSTGIILNVDGTLNILDSVITGDRQGVIVRAGTANIEKSKIVSTGTYELGEANNRFTGTWSSGTEVAYAALVVGDNNAAYSSDAICNLTNGTKVEMQGDGVGRTIHISSDSEKAELNTDSTISDAYEYEIRTKGHYFGKNTYINGVQLPVDDSGNPLLSNQ